MFFKNEIVFLKIQNEIIQLKNKQKKEHMVITTVIVGGDGVGKTTYLHRLSSGQFEKVYSPTSKPIVRTISINNVKFDVIDTPGQNVYVNRYGDIDCAIIMVDSNTKSAMQSIELWTRHIVTRYGDIPIAICANKVDVGASKARFTGDNCFLTSVRRNQNLEAPFKYLTHKVMM